MIAAIDQEAGLGKDNQIPWPRLAKDMTFFRRTTIGNAVIMGRKTWDSLPKQPLPDRINIVLSHTAKPLRGATVATNLDAAFEVARDRSAFVIGGASIYSQAIDGASKVYLTRVTGSYGCDVFFPIKALEADFKCEVLAYHPAEAGEDLVAPAFRIEMWTRR